MSKTKRQAEADAERTAVAISCNVGIYEPGELPERAQVWGINHAYRHQVDPKLHRLYVMDSLHLFPSDFWKFCRGRHKACRLFTRSANLDIRAEPYPLPSVVRRFGRPYFTCTISYALAHALLEGFDDIYLKNVYGLPGSAEYFSQKPCLDYWIGVALGQGRKVYICGASDLGKPYPWRADLYGYLDPVYDLGVDESMASALRAQESIVNHWKPAEGVDIDFVKKFSECIIDE